MDQLQLNWLARMLHRFGNNSIRSLRRTSNSHSDMSAAALTKPAVLWVA
jgi:hypothetical protein